MLDIVTLETGPLQVNTYIVGDSKSEDCVIIDPGGTDWVLETLEKKRKKCTHILLTHAHYDHIGGAESVRNATGALICILDKEEPYLRDSRMNLAAMFWDSAFSGFHADKILKDGEILKVAGLSFEVIACPGHTPGGASYYLRDQQVLFCGDTLFLDSYGRTDLPGGNMQDLSDTIIRRLFILEGEIRVYPGHGEMTDLSIERERNPIRAYGRYFS